jgi:hypothetical protein
MARWRGQKRALSGVAWVPFSAAVPLLGPCFPGRLLCALDLLSDSVTGCRFTCGVVVQLHHTGFGGRLVSDRDVASAGSSKLSMGEAHRCESVTGAEHRCFESLLTTIWPRSHSIAWRWYAALVGPSQLRGQEGEARGWLMHRGRGCLA